MPSPEARLPASRWRTAVRGAVLVACALALAACGGRSKLVPTQLNETFSFDEMYSQEFDTSPTLACEAARRTLLGQGYVVTRADAGAVEASKDFQPEPDIHAKLSMRVSCVPQGGDDTLVFATALQESYILRKSPSSASLGVSAVGSLSLPIGMREDSLVRVASSTVQDADFYRRFFERIEFYLPSLPIRRAPSQSSQALPPLSPATPETAVTGDVPE